MKFDVIKACIVRGNTYKAGDVVDLDETTSTALMAMGRVAPHSTKVVTEDRSIGLSEDKPKPKRRAKAKK